MKQIQEKYSKKHIDYSILKPLPYEIKRYLDDGFYNMPDNSVRRNLSWKTEYINKQSTVIDFGELCMISRLHFTKCKLMTVDIAIAEKEEGPFINLYRDMIIISGNIKVLKVGNLPGRFIKITVTKGSPIQDFSKLECFGLSMSQLKEVYSEDMLQILLYNTYSLIYNK